MDVKSLTLALSWLSAIVKSGVRGIKQCSVALFNANTCAVTYMKRLDSLAFSFHI